MARGGQRQGAVGPTAEGTGVPQVLLEPAEGRGVDGGLLAQLAAQGLEVDVVEG